MNWILLIGIVFLSSSVSAQYQQRELVTINEGKQALMKGLVPYKNEYRDFNISNYIDSSQFCKQMTYYGCQYGVRFKPIKRGIPSGDSILQSPYTYEPIYNYLEHSSNPFLYNFNYDFDLDTQVYKINEINKLKNWKCENTVNYESERDCKTRILKGLILRQLNNIAIDSFVTRVLQNVNLNLVENGYTIEFMAYFDNSGMFKKLYLSNSTLDLDSSKLSTYTIQKNQNKWMQVYYSPLSIWRNVLNSTQRQYFKTDMTTIIYFDESQNKYNKFSNYSKIPLRKKRIKQDIEYYFYLKNPKPYQSKSTQTIQQIQDKYFESSVNAEPQSMEELLKTYQIIEAQFKSNYPQFMESIEQNLRSMPQMTPLPFTIFPNQYEKCTAKNAMYSPCKDEIQSKDIYGYLLKFSIQSKIQSPRGGLWIDGVEQIVPSKRIIQIQVFDPIQ